MNPTSTRREKTIYIAQAGLIAAIYTVLTMIAAGFDLASGAIQVRFSEALCVLPYFTHAAVPGLTLGCLISNLVTGCALPDIIFGSLATFLGAIGSYYLRRNRCLVSIPPIVSNMLISVPVRGSLHKLVKHCRPPNGTFFHFKFLYPARLLIFPLDRPAEISDIE